MRGCFVKCHEKKGVEMMESVRDLFGLGGGSEVCDGKCACMCV